MYDDGDYGGIDEFMRIEREALRRAASEFALLGLLSDSSAIRVPRPPASITGEECAKVSDHILKEGGGTWGDAIRARGNT